MSQIDFSKVTLTKRKLANHLLLSYFYLSRKSVTWDTLRDTFWFSRDKRHFSTVSTSISFCEIFINLPCKLLKLTLHFNPYFWHFLCFTKLWNIFNNFCKITCKFICIKASTYFLVEFCHIKVSREKYACHVKFLIFAWQT